MGYPKIEDRYWILINDQMNRSDNNGNKLSLFACSKCSTLVLARKYVIAKGYVTCMGCVNEYYKTNLIGNRYGKLRVLQYNEIESKNKHQAVYDCGCDCGKIVPIRAYRLTNGTSTSCGCYFINLLQNGDAHRTHNLSKEPIYFIYNSMKARCYNSNTPNYHRYGGRGIYICDEWMGENGFVNFYNDMNPSYVQHVNMYGKENTSIDRIDNDGPYAPWNCRWATQLEQNNNTINCTKAVVNGIEYPSLSEVSRILNVDYNCVKYYNSINKLEEYINNTN